jgi:hypothetical protein
MKLARHVQRRIRGRPPYRRYASESVRLSRSLSHVALRASPRRGTATRAPVRAALNALSHRSVDGRNPSATKCRTRRPAVALFATRSRPIAPRIANRHACEERGARPA